MKEKRYHPAYLITLILLVSLPYAWLTYSLPLDWDAAVFAYIGKGILNGYMPYLDFWDHKGPLLFLLNAAGIAMTGDLGGIYILEGLLLVTSICLSFHLWTRLIHSGWAFIISLLILFTYFIRFEGGDLTETWIMPFTLLTYSYACQVFFNRPDKKSSITLSALLGISIAVAVLTRINNCAGLLALTAGFILIRKDSRRISILTVLLSFIAVCAPVLYWLFANQAITPFIEQYFFYNFSYMQTTPEGETHLIRKRLRGLRRSLEIVFKTPLGVALILSNLYALFKRKLHNSAGAANSERTVTIIFLFVFLADFIAITLSNRFYPHYYVIITPALAILSSLTVRTNYNLFSSLLGKKKWLMNLTLLLLLLITAFPILRKSFQYYRITGLRLSHSSQYKVTEYVKQHSASTDRIVAPVFVLLGADRLAPSKFIYTLQVQANYKNTPQSFLNDLQEHRPLYVITRLRDYRLEQQKRQKQEQPEHLRAIHEFIDDNYEYETTLEENVFMKRKN